VNGEANKIDANRRQERLTAIGRRRGPRSQNATFRPPGSFELKSSVDPRKVSSRSSYKENCSALDKLRVGLAAALQGAPDDVQDRAATQLRDGAIEVVKWGGVANGNKEWLLHNSGRLKPQFASVLAQLSIG
jgi:hypothetical protein